MSEPFIAEIRMFATNFAPRGWAYCDGQTLQISQNTALFSLVGTMYGGDGRTDFLLPNLKGRIPIHQGSGPGLTLRRVGQRSGQKTVTLTAGQMPSHTHQLRACNEDIDEEGGPNPAGNSTGSVSSESRSPVKLYQTSTSSLTDMATGALPNEGGGQAHNNVQPYQVIPFCIALQGLYPSRS